MSKPVVDDRKKADGFFSISPDDLVLPPQEERGRVSPVTGLELDSLAYSIYANGQESPIGVRKNHEGKLQVVFGFTRLAAIQMIRAGFTAANGEVCRNPDLRVLVRTLSGTPEQAFLQTIEENRARNDTNPLDDAMNQLYLRQKLHMSYADIAKFYCYPNPQKVYQLERILDLEEPFRMALQAKEISFAAAVDLASLPSEKRQAALDAASVDGKKPTAAAIRSFARSIQLDLEEEEEARLVNPPVVTAVASDVPVDPLAAAMSTAPQAATNPAPAKVNPGKRTGVASDSKTLQLSRKERHNAWQMIVDDDNTSDDLKKLVQMLIRHDNGKLKDETLMKNLQAMFPVPKD